MANALIVIRPYRQEGVWMFDDPAAGLEQEPFVAGVPEMIERFVAGIPDAQNGFELTFSAEPFPGHQAKLIWLRPEYEGNWYGWPETRQEGWLCPALFRYFDEAPQALYCLARPKGAQAARPSELGVAANADVSLVSLDAKLDRVLAELTSLSARIALLEQPGTSVTERAGERSDEMQPADRLDDLMSRFLALSPAEQRESIAAANAYLATEQGRREFGLPADQDDAAKRARRLEKH